MKKLLVVMVITLMMTSGAYALQADWQVDINVVGAVAPVQSTGAVSVGAYSEAGGYATLDGPDAMDTAIPGGNILAGAYELDIVNGASGAQSQTDFIAIPSSASDLDLWNLKVSIVGAAAGAVPVQLEAKFNDWGAFAPITDPNFSIYLFAGQLTLDQAKAATPIFIGNLANYSEFSTNGLRAPALQLAAGQSVYYTLVAGSIPEPGSMLALFSGLVGLVGFGIRRRR